MQEIIKVYKIIAGLNFLNLSILKNIKKINVNIRTVGRINMIISISLQPDIAAQTSVSTFQNI